MGFLAVFRPSSFSPEVLASAGATVPALPDGGRVRSPAGFGVPGTAGAKLSTWERAGAGFHRRSTSSHRRVRARRLRRAEQSAPVAQVRPALVREARRVDDQVDA